MLLCYIRYSETIGQGTAMRYLHIIFYYEGIKMSLKQVLIYIFPVTAASVSTRVVSWKDAAEMNDSVARDALVIPNN